jgi:CheY-like chemotaxis protein
MPNGGTLTFRTAIPEDGWAELAVEDTGCGMEAEVLAHVMEPFFTTKAVDQGTGLGLSMTYGVVKAHGGILDVASQPGQGTVVRIRIPRRAAPVEPEGPTEEPAQDLRELRVLLVDDDIDVQFLVARMLRKAGVHQVDTVSSGQEALESLRAGELPSLVILDQNMPGLNGAQTLKRIRALHPAMPVLISSGQPGLEEIAEFRQPGVGIIPKPFTLEEIQEKLARFERGPGPL